MEKASETLQKIADHVSISPQAQGAPPPPKDALPGPGKPDCPVCHGVGYISLDVSLDDPQFGKLFACACRVEEVHDAQEAQLQRMAAVGSLKYKTFENFIPEGHANEHAQRNSLRRAFDQCKAFSEEPRGWLLLLGTYGCGKTHLAAAIANAQLKQGKPVVFATVPDLLDHLRATFAPSSAVQYDEMFERIRNAPLLILDDLGTESPTSWAQEKLYQLINHRYTNQLPTVVTTNVELERIDPRLRSRLVDMDLVRKISIKAPDFRRADTDSEQHMLSTLALHRTQTFANFDLRKGEIKGENQRKLHTAFIEAQDFAQNPGGWLVLTGGHGVGKTHLAAAIANHCVYNGYPALFITFTDLLDHLRATFSPDSLTRYDQRFNEVRSAPMLILDNLTLESATPWAVEKLKQLLDYRYITQLPTVITTVVEAKDMGPWYETRLLDPRLSTVCHIEVPIYKGPRAARRTPRR